MLLHVYLLSALLAWDCPRHAAWPHSTRARLVSLPRLPCAGVGVCAEETGRCHCPPGFEGNACERMPCPPGCSGHGRCTTVPSSAGDNLGNSARFRLRLRRDGAMRCSCAPGYAGYDCSMRAVPHNVPQPRAPAPSPACPRAPPWQHIPAAASTSRTSLAEAEVCAGRGRCEAGACVCAHGVGGAACEQLTPMYCFHCRHHSMCIGRSNRDIISNRNHTTACNNPSIPRALSSILAALRGTASSSGSGSGTTAGLKRGVADGDGEGLYSFNPTRFSELLLWRTGFAPLPWKSRARHASSTDASAATETRERAATAMMSPAAILEAASGCADAPLLGTAALHAADPSAYYRRQAERAAWVVSDRAHVSSTARRELRQLLGVGIESSNSRAGGCNRDSPDSTERRQCVEDSGDSGGLHTDSELGLDVSHAQVCPHVRRVKVGGEDGGRSPEGQYTLCLPLRIPPGRHEHCVVYSFGSGHDYSFDDAMRARFGCEVHAFDPTTPREPRCRASSGVSFHPVGLGTRGQERIRRFTLGAIARLLKHPRVDVIKIDIEGFEWAPLAQMLGLPDEDWGLYSDERVSHNARAPRQDVESLKTLRSARLLLFELHFFRGRSYGTWEHKIRALRALRRIGFRPFFIRENPLCQKHRGVPCYEASFLNMMFERLSDSANERTDDNENTALWNLTAGNGAKAPPCLHSETIDSYAFTPRPEHRTGILDTGN